MGLKKFIFGEDKKSESNAESAEQAGADSSEGKFNEPCALCGAAGTEKKWAGQYWHKKCMRKSKKIAKGMI
ncbi:MAG: hypothetical protein HYW05_03520 [Candidatus Diapherotrites archaeon]|nr:hypothetical protein [Candidatus Diapherotrites archaeon]